MELQILIDELDRSLRNCAHWKARKNRNWARTAFDQAYGKAEMFNRLYPDTEEQVIELWDTKYRPEFEKIIYGD